MPEPKLDDFKSAAQRLAGIATRTPLLENLDVNKQLGCRLLIKAECAQRTGAFKFRGAYNRICQMTPEEKKNGVLTYSSGNHAKGVAMAARLLGTSALIVMPQDAPAAKIAETKKLDASVVTFDRNSENSDEVVANLSQKTGRLIVPPSGNTHVLTGAGAVALEVLEQIDDGVNIDAVLIPCGGGGLTAATALVMGALSPKTEIYAVEPELFDDTRRSLEAGHRVENPKGQKTICDAIMTPMPNAHTFAVNSRLLAGGLTVNDNEVRDAMLFAFQNFKIVVEPGAAVAIAAVLNKKVVTKGKTIVAIVTGGNIDPARFFKLLNQTNE